MTGARLLANQAFQAKQGYSLFENQNIYTLGTANNVQLWDDSFIISTKRNGPDYWNRDGHGEMKGSVSKKITGLGKYSFHALAILKNGDEPQFIFKTHVGDRDARIYDIRDPRKVAAINLYLREAAQTWKDELDNPDHPRDGKYDVISLPEKFVMELFANDPVYEICAKTRKITRVEGGIMTGQRPGYTRFQSDAI
jgi:hypothetical protein